MRAGASNAEWLAACYYCTIVVRSTYIARRIEELASCVRLPCVNFYWLDDMLLATVPSTALLSS